MKFLYFIALCFAFLVGCKPATGANDQSLVNQQFFTPARAAYLIDAVDTAIKGEKAIQLDSLTLQLGHQPSVDELKALQDKISLDWKPVEEGLNTLKSARVVWEQQLASGQIDAVQVALLIRESFCRFSYLIGDKPKILVLLKQNFC